MRTFIAALAMFGVALAAPAAADPPATVIAIPPLSTPTDTKLEGGGTTLGIAWQATQLIATDLRATSELYPVGPDQKDFYSYPEVTAPSFPRWRSKGVKALVTGFVQARSDGRLTIGCYVYDVDKGRELGRKGFVVSPGDWRRAAHKCSGLAYSVITGAPDIFDTRIAYVAESGSGPARTKKVAVIDSDGNNQVTLTKGDSFVITPRLSPGAQTIAFTSFSGGNPHIELVNVETGVQRPLLSGKFMSFSPSFSADGKRIAFAMMQGINSDIYVIGAAGGMPQRLTTAPGIDTTPSYSPDGTKIVFESDRSGSPQLYIMNADGSDQRRLSFGSGWYSAPEWSPDGKWIAFTRRASDGRRVGVIHSDGTNEKILTRGTTDEGPRWAPSSRELVFQRSDASGRQALYRVTLEGEEPRLVATAQDGSDPDWSGVVD
ncbi:MAG: Tol-Pal system protein TolB [Sphingomonas sp.]|nr:Tol-Pal system protein TolB [Sphingomonas sp.]